MIESMMTLSLSSSPLSFKFKLTLILTVSFLQGVSGWGQHRDFQDQFFVAFDGRAPQMYSWLFNQTECEKTFSITESVGIIKDLDDQTHFRLVPSWKFERPDGTHVSHRERRCVLHQSVMDSLASRARSVRFGNRVCDVVDDCEQEEEGSLVGYELTIRYKWRPIWAVFVTVVTSCKLARVFSADPQQLQSREFTERWILNYENKMDPSEYDNDDDWWGLVLLLLLMSSSLLVCFCCCAFAAIMESKLNIFPIFILTVLFIFMLVNVTL